MTFIRHRIESGRLAPGLVDLNIPIFPGMNELGSESSEAMARCVKPGGRRRPQRVESFSRIGRPTIALFRF